MATDWFNPTTITQYAEDGAENVHVRWDDSNNFAGLRSSSASVGTVAPLVHIARSPKPNITNKTYYLKLTGFKFRQLPDVINGIELKIVSRRAGRVTDDTITLTHNEKIIGDNQATLELDPNTTYGSEDSLWGLKSISKEMLEDSSFGVVVRFKSHPKWPHKDPIDLISAQLRIH